MIIFEQKWHTSRKEFYRYSGKYVLPVFTGILVKKCATLPWRQFGATMRVITLEWSEGRPRLQHCVVSSPLQLTNA